MPGYQQTPPHHNSQKQKWLPKSARACLAQHPAGWNSRSFSQASRRQVSPSPVPVTVAPHSPGRAQGDPLQAPEEQGGPPAGLCRTGQGCQLGLGIETPPLPRGHHVLCHWDPRDRLAPWTALLRGISRPLPSSLGPGTQSAPQAPPWQGRNPAPQRGLPGAARLPPPQIRLLPPASDLVWLLRQQDP